MAIAQDNEILASDINVLANYYGTCPTDASTVAKVATLSLSNSFVLTTGVSITIKFTYSNIATNPTLNVNSTGAKAIYWHGAALTSAQYWQAGAVLSFVYNGTQWELIGIAKDNNTTYSSLKNPYAININVDGTQIATYDGSSGQSVNFQSGDNITLSGTTGAITINGSSSNLTVAMGTYEGIADDTQYSDTRGHYQTITPGLSQIYCVYVWPYSTQIENFPWGSYPNMIEINDYNRRYWISINSGWASNSANLRIYGYDDAGDTRGYYNVIAVDDNEFVVYGDGSQTVYLNVDDDRHYEGRIDAACNIEGQMYKYIAIGEA